MLTTIDLTSDQVKAVTIAEDIPIRQRMSVVEAQQKLNEAKENFEQAACTIRKDVSPRINRGITLLLEIDKAGAWEGLPYRSIRQFIHHELMPQLGLSDKQIYKKVNAARVRQEVSQICDNADAIPDNQLEALGKLPTEEWLDAWEEINATTSGAKVTGKHVKNIVERRLQSKNTENFNFNDSSQSQHESAELLKPERNVSADSHQTLFTTSAPYQVDEIVIIQCCANSATPEQLHYSGCWGVVHHLLEATAIVAVAGNLVESSFEDLYRIPNPSPTLLQVCDRIALLWQVQNLPLSVQHLLETFYQRQLDFSQEDLDVLTAIENHCKPSFHASSDFRNNGLSKEYQHNLENSAFLPTELPV